MNQAAREGIIPFEGPWKFGSYVDITDDEIEKLRHKLSNKEIIALARRAREFKMKELENRLVVRKKLFELKKNLKQRSSMNLKEKIVAFHKALMFIHESGKLAEYIFDISVNDLDRLSAGPEQSWDISARKMVTWESTQIVKDIL